MYTATLSFATVRQLIVFIIDILYFSFVSYIWLHSFKYTVLYKYVCM